MDSHFWKWSGARRPDYRRYTVAEGGAPLPLGSTSHRKRLRSAGEEDHEEPASCSTRPNPEGLGEEELEEEGGAEGAEPGRLCQRCHIMAAQLNRQAAALADTAALKDPVYAAFLLDKLQRLQWPRRGPRVSADARCELCSASFHQLREVALRRALGGVSRERTAGSAPAASTPPSSAASKPAREQQPGSSDDVGGAPWGWGGVQSTYLGGGRAKRLATVTPLPPSTQRHLEGVWRVSCQASGRQLMGSASEGDHVTPKVSTHSIATQTVQSPSAAAAFFLRAAQKLSLSRRKRSCPGPPSPGLLLYTGGFSGALQLSPPAVPPCLLRAGSKVKDTPGMGKVKVMVRICSVSSGESSESTSFLKVDGRKKQLNLCESAVGGATRRSSASAPKTFTFDAIFTQDASQAEVCSGTLTDVLQSVVNGADGCIFCYGHANLGKSYTMIGRDCSTQSLGVAPTAISWLFKVMEERSEKLGATFSLRVSAVELSGREEALTDLLAEVSGQQGAPGAAVSLHHDPVCGSQLQNQTELLASSAERAAFLLDVALAARRSSSHAPADQELRRNSHFLFTLHLLQERLERSSKATVCRRSRLHLLDLGSCETDVGRTREGGGAPCLSLSGLGNVVLALANGAKHVPYRDSKLTMLLSQSLGNINCRTTMVAHVSAAPPSFMETLTTLQLAARIHRSRSRKKQRGSGSSGGESSCEEGPAHPAHRRPSHPRPARRDPDPAPLLPAEPDGSSGSERSCDTVVYVGGGAAAGVSDPGDGEAPPPSFIPIIPSLNKKPLKEAAPPDGDRLKCNTFAELQERLDGMDGRSQARQDSQRVRPGPSGSPLGPSGAARRTSVDGGNLTSEDPGLHHNVSFGGCVPKISASPSPPRTSLSWSPLVQTGHQIRTAEPPAEWHLEGGLLRTTIRLQQPLELSGEDELVFTVMEEIPHAFFPDNGRPADLVPVRTARPVSIISSINDQYDLLTSQSGAGAATSWPAEVSADTINMRDQNMQMSLERDISRLGTSEPDGAEAAAQNQPGPSVGPGSPGTSAAQSPTGFSSLSRKTKTTSSPRPDLLRRRSSPPDPADADFLCQVNKNGSGSTPRRLAAAAAGSRPAKDGPVAPRGGDGREKSGSRRGGDAPVKLPRLARGAATLGAESGPPGPESKPGSDGTPSFGSLRKKSNRSGSGPVPQPSHEQKTRVLRAGGPGRPASPASPGPRTPDEEPRLPAASLSHKPDRGRRRELHAGTLDRTHGTTRDPASPGAHRRSGHSAPRPGAAGGPQGALPGSKSQTSVPRRLDPACGRGAGPPDRPLAAAKSGRGGVSGPKRTLGGPNPPTALRKQPASPYSTVTAPRRHSHHGSDSSSVLSGELPPAMGRTAIFHRGGGGGSSGYESMMRDSETTGSASSAHDSTSESGGGTAAPGRCRTVKSPRKRGHGFLRRRLIPAPLPDASAVGRKGQWAELPPLGGALKEPFEIKVYEIDDVAHLQRGREEELEPLHHLEKGLLYCNARLRELERRQQQIRELKVKHQRLKSELLEAERQLMLTPGRWRSQMEVDQDLDRESQDYVEALSRVTVEMQRLIDLCRSRVMMETCFDIAVATAGGMQEA